MNNYNNQTFIQPLEVTNMNIDYLQVKKGALILRALNHKLRQQVLKLLEENGRLTVTEIYVRLRLEQSVASQHLAILRRAGIVKTERDGKYIYYNINYARVDEINKCVVELVS
jgi:DNA-binding transcriptional ArsR family regulator